MFFQLTNETDRDIFMKIMTTTKLKNIITERISKLEDKDLLEAINHILDSKGNSNKIYEINETQRGKIKNSKLQLKEGKRLTNEKVFEEIGKWLKEK
jgi:hypothetical protein